MTVPCRHAFVSVLFWALVACANGRGPEEDPLCYRAICGCWEERSLQAIIAVVDGDGRPASGVALSCSASEESFGATNEAGILRFSAEGKSSPGCGYIAACETVSLHDRHGNSIATFALTPLLRGNEVLAGGYTLRATPVPPNLE